MSGARSAASPKVAILAATGEDAETLARLAMIRGGVARGLGQSEADNPYSADDPRALFWLFGVRDHPAPAAPGSAKARDRRGPAWSALELAVLELGAGLGADILGGVVNKTTAAVRNQRARIKAAAK